MTSNFVSAVENLTDSERRALIGAAAGFRDRHAADGTPRLAEFWNALAAFVAEVSDAEHAAFEEMETGLSGGVAEIVDDEDGSAESSQV